MTKNLKTLAIIFSIVLNIVFIGLYFYHKADLLPLIGHRTSHNHLLYEELHLNREQLDRFRPARDRFHVFVNKQGLEIKAKQLELIDLLSMEHPDRLAIDAKQLEIQTLQQQLQAMVIDHLLEERRILTPEQRQRFFALIRERIKESSGPRPRWMPRKHGSPSKWERR